MKTLYNVARGVHWWS